MTVALVIAGWLAAGLVVALVVGRRTVRIRDRHGGDDR